MALAAALLFAGCVGRGAAIGPDAPGVPRPPTPGSSAEVRAATIQGLGEVLVTGTGLTLYIFAPDQHRTSTCLGACALEWPPDILPAGVVRPQAGPGVAARLLGTILRPDGSRQVTYAGWPLYRWNADVRPGQATGQALYNWQGRWYVIDPAGKLVTTLP